MYKLHVFSDNQHFVDGSADFITELATQAIAERGRFTIALSGGGTPRPIYARLASDEYRDNIDWSRVHIFFGDERCVPPDDTRSNFKMANENMLSKLPLPEGNSYRIRGEDDPAMAALAYELEIQRLYRTLAFPAFDLILLGMGDNGHTASLFPGTAALREKKRLCVPQYVEVMGTWRVTFTAPLINAAHNVAFMAEGAGKAEMLARVLNGPFDPDVLPSQMIQPTNGELHWLVDSAAAAKVLASQ